MKGFIFLLLLAGCTTDEKVVLSCPENATLTNTDECFCDDGFYGELTLSDAEYEGECLSGLEMAVKTGDPTYLSSEQEIIAAAQEELATIITRDEEMLRALYGTETVSYTPTEWSQHIVNVDLTNNFILVQGTDYGYSLAVAGSQGESRYAAFGGNVVARLHNGDETGFAMPFERVLNWILSGDPEQTIDSLSVGVAFLGWDEPDVEAWLSNRDSDWNITVCDNPDEVSDCLNSDLLVLGSNGTVSDLESMSVHLHRRITEGAKILFLHTETWATSDVGTAILAALHTTYGEYGGNYWSNDNASWGTVDEMLAAGGSARELNTMLGHFEASDYWFDWGECTDWVGQTFCHDIAGFRSEFLNGAQTLRNQLSVNDGQNVDVFASEGDRIWKLLVLLGDWYRQNIQYPYSRSDADIMPFMKSYFADHATVYSRAFNPPQADLGSFSANITSQDVDLLSVDVQVDTSARGGFTAIGYSAVPGQTFTIRRTDSSDLPAQVFINTQRTGSTREFDEGQYNRPKYLQSHPVRIVSGDTVRLTSPYGGTLQLSVAASDSDQQIALSLENVSLHPVLGEGGDIETYVNELETTQLPFTEIRNPYVQIHSKVDMMLTSIDDYGGDLDLFFDELHEYMIFDTYNLAGFAGADLSLNDAVMAVCDDFGWDCTSEEIHRLPALQHINIDTYAHCGGGCSGNPYDQAWALHPLGWGETHEIGHNLQRSRLGIYGGRSSEVSNQIFPLHKHWSYYAETGIAMSGDRVDYMGTFDLLQQAQQTADPTASVYDALWSAEGIYDNNAERMAFFMQIVHHSDGLEFLQTGWDIFTLMYLHERLFSSVSDWAAQKDALGFSTYSTMPEIDGNDFMLLSLSFISRIDQRPFFNMWGITYSDQASNQVAEYGFPLAERVFFASDNANGQPYPEPIPVDGVSPWPTE